MNTRSAFAGAVLVMLWSSASVARLDAAIQAQATVSFPSPQPVGTSITVTASATNSNAGPTTYKFEIAAGADGAFGMVRDFSLTKTFVWVPTTSEGDYQIRVTARDYVAGESSQVVIPYSLTTRISGGAAALTLSTHPLVALFSAPPCASGRTIRVRFARTGTSAYSFTNSRPCASTSTNFLVAGLYPATGYTMSYQIVLGSQVYTSPGLSIVTGAAPSGNAYRLDFDSCPRGENCSYNANSQTPAGCPPVLLAGFTTARDRAAFQLA